jgi:hypothetical protein
MLRSLAGRTIFASPAAALAGFHPERVFLRRADNCLSADHTLLLLWRNSIFYAGFRHK